MNQDADEDPIDEKTQLEGEFLDHYMIHSHALLTHKVPTPIKDIRF